MAGRQTSTDHRGLIRNYGREEKSGVLCRVSEKRNKVPTFYGSKLYTVPIIAHSLLYVLSLSTIYGYIIAYILALMATGKAEWNALSISTDYHSP